LGNPEDLVKLEEMKVPEMGVDEIEVSMIAAPVNPSDINQIQGLYPIKPTLPAVGGNEGVGVVTGVGSSVDTVKEGDIVMPIQPGIGTWRTLLVSKASNFHRLPPNVPAKFAATLQVNPPTAYRMLKDFVPLSRGDTVIQNGSNSAVGQSVIQLATAWGINTVNIIRSRPVESSNDFDVAGYLKGLGGSEVITEEFADSRRMKELMKDYAPPPLALNCVGGKSSTTLARHMKEGGTMVTYGGMSRQPVAIPTSAFIFKEIRCVGYWNGMWIIRNSEKNKRLVEEMFDDLCQLAIDGYLSPPHCTQSNIQDYKMALSNALRPFISTKQLLVFNESLI
jgi:trans-2-enoyl-CoA reductase